MEPLEGGRDGDRGGDRARGSPYLLCSAALLADGCQVAQNQLGGLRLPRAALPTERQSPPLTHPPSAPLMHPMPRETHGARLVRPAQSGQCSLRAARGDGRPSPDDDTLVVFGIHHFGVGDVCNCKEVPGGGGRHIGITVSPQRGHLGLWALGEGGGTATRYSRRVLTQRPAFVLQHLLHPIDVVKAVGIHRHQDAADIGLQESKERLWVLGEQCPRGTPAALSLHR